MGIHAITDAERIEKIKKAYNEYNDTLHDIRGCSDVHCYIRHPLGGMGTNGGCTCPADRFIVQRFMMATKRLRKVLDETTL